MHPGWLRTLYQDLVRTDTDAEQRQVLHDATAQATRQVVALDRFRTRETRSQRPDPKDLEHQIHVWELYAFGRIADLLLERGYPGETQPDGAITRWPLPERLALRTGFLTDTGLTTFEHTTAFSPFHHEIVAVTRDDSLDHVALEGIYWPGLRLGDLNLQRAGAHVRAPSHLVDRRTATSSHLWFTHRRVPRTTRDWGSGWGSNSQWHTSLARFYEDGQGLHCNWDGTFDLATDPPAPERPDGRPDASEALDIDRRRELLLHRCLVRTPPPGWDEEDWLPLQDRMTLRPGTTWPLRAGDLVPSQEP